MGAVDWISAGGASMQCLPRVAWFFKTQPKQDPKREMHKSPEAHHHLVSEVSCMTHDGSQSSLTKR